MKGRLTQELSKAFFKACEQAGHTYTEDMNGYQQEGYGLVDLTIYKGKF